MKRTPIALLAAATLTACQTPDHITTTAPTPTSSTTTTSPPPVIRLPAYKEPKSLIVAPNPTTSSTTPAERLTPPIQATEPPTFDPVAHVNSLAYCWQCPAPALEAYRIVAAHYGWSSATIEARAQFVERIMAGESAFCWNARAWSHHTALLMPCTEIGQGTRDDVGFGQITNVLRPLTCERAGLCTIADTVATPWSSMLAYVIVLDELGKAPWCYHENGRPNTHIRNGDCATWPG